MCHEGAVSTFFVRWRLIRATKMGCKKPLSMAIEISSKAFLCNRKLYNILLEATRFSIFLCRLQTVCLTDVLATNTDLSTSPIALFARAKEQKRPLYGMERFYKLEIQLHILTRSSLGANGQIQQVGISIAGAGIWGRYHLYPNDLGSRVSIRILVSEVDSHVYSGSFVIQWHAIRTFRLIQTRVH